MSLICEVFGCSERAFERGMCKRHFNNWKRDQAGCAGKLTALERDLNEARRCYGRAVGIQPRLSWRKRIQHLEAQMMTAL